MTQPLSVALQRRLREIVGEKHVITDPDRLLVYESDALTAYRWPPRAVVLPADTAEVSSVMGVLHGEGIPMVPRGAGTGLSGGALAPEGAVVLGTARMSRILSLDPVSRDAKSGTVDGRPRQKSRTASRYLPFHSVHSGGKPPTL